MLITAFLGGATDAQAVDLDDARLIEEAERDLARALQITGAPSMVHLTRHARVIPQYTLGHLDRVAQIERALGAFAGLHLAASWWGGISVADCVMSAASLATRLGSGPAQARR